MTIDEIIEEGERLEREAKAAWRNSCIADAKEATRRLSEWRNVWCPRLIAVAKAAVEAERLTAIFQRDYITAPPDADSTAWTQRAWAASGEADDAIEKLFAAVRGDAGGEG